LKMRKEKGNREKKKKKKPREFNGHATTEVVVSGQLLDVEYPKKKKKEGT